MNTEEIKILINKYFDNELEKNKESMLFFQISESEELRNYFKGLNFIQNTIYESKEKYPQNLEERIFEKLGNPTGPDKSSYMFSGRIISSISYVLGIFLLFLSLFLYFESAGQKNEIEIVNREIQRQTRIINLLYNALPAAQVESNFENEIIINANL